MNFKKINNISGWLVFAIAYIVYLLTLEPTVSFWDCGEFLATAYKLEVGHSPGAPLFMMITRLFGAAAPGIGKAAFFMNSVSALTSGFTILFLFWTITHFTRKIFIRNNNGELTTGNIVAIIGAGLVGALAYTFSDTFWFSAVEGEVYATSSFFTAISFWAILKWEDQADQPYADRWLILIAYLMGLSVGVHLLNLLTIPSIALVYYLKKYKFTPTGVIISILVGCGLLAFAQFGVIQYLPLIASWFELHFVNDFGLPYNSGAIFFLILLTGLIIYGLIYARKKNKYNLHVALLSVSFIILGFLSYIAVVIRANADLPVNMTNPNTIMTLLPYLQRDQYGQQPLLYGPDYTSRPSGIDSGRAIYAPMTVDGKAVYQQVDNKVSYKYDNGRLFPRIWDGNDPNHVRFYQQYLGLSNGEDPTGADNMKFFVGYQLNWMWWRYFMWNYSGRQNDIEGQGNPKEGNWITGIKPIDQFRGLGDMDKMDDFYRTNRARNQLYLLPFIIGILGFVYQFKKDKKDFAVVALFFFFTGIAVQLFINNTPLQPRERDYQYITAYVYAIWIGFGVVFLSDLFSKKIKSGTAAPALATALCLLAAPVLMASQEWDDHDRSQKTLARDHAMNMLQTCDSNAILITYGDNDTYPLWYLQEVEGIRRDVRIINANLLGTDWMNAELFKKVNDADAVPVIWKPQDFMGNNLNYISVDPNPKLGDRHFDLEEVIRFFCDPKNRAMMSNGAMMAYLPTSHLSLTIDKNALVRNKWVPASEINNIPDTINFNYNKGAASRMELAMMNIIAGVAKDGWRRPIYVTDGTPEIGLDNYFRKEGLVNKFMPTNPPATASQIPVFADMDKSLNMFMNIYSLGKANGNDVYYDEPNRRIFIGFRQSAALLAMNLIANNRKADAIRLLDNVMGRISERAAGYEVSPQDRTMLLFLQCYAQAGAKNQFGKLAKKLQANAVKDASYILSISEDGREALALDASTDLNTLNALVNFANVLGDKPLADEFSKTLQNESTRLFNGISGLKQYMQQQMQPQQQAQDEGDE